jgi:hypothetical protein
LDGDGADAVGIYNTDGTWALWNTTTYVADNVTFGPAGMQPVVGDWDGRNY